MSALLPDDLVRAALVTALTGDLPATSILTGPLRDGAGTPTPQVTTLTTGSLPHEPDLGGTSTPSVRPYSVQINVRGAPNSYAAGLVLVRKVVASMQKNSLNESKVASCLIQNGPNFLGLDNQGRAEWTVNLLVTIYE